LARKSSDRYQNYHEFRAAVLALRKPETSPATVWDRVRAAVVDGVVIAIIAWILFQLTLAVTGKGWTSTMPQGMKLNFVLGGVIALLIVGVPEGLRGMWIGKWLIGIRVANLEGQVAGLPRALSRALILQVINFVALVAQLNGSYQNVKTSLLLVTGVGLRALLLITVRRSNGNMMVHDWLTGTRGIKRLAGVQKQHGEEQRKAAPTRY